MTKLIAKFLPRQVQTPASILAITADVILKITAPGGSLIPWAMSMYLVIDRNISSVFAPLLRNFKSNDTLILYDITCMVSYVDNKYYHVSSLRLVMSNVWSKGIVLDILPIIILKSGYMKIKTARTSGCVFITP